MMEVIISGSELQAARVAFRHYREQLEEWSHSAYPPNREYAQNQIVVVDGILNRINERCPQCRNRLDNCTCCPQCGAPEPPHKDSCDHFK